MTDGLHVLVSLDTVSASAIVRVAGPATAETLPAVRRVLERTVLVAGPVVTVDVSGCSVLDDVVVAYLLEEGERLDAWGGSLAVEGAAYSRPADAAAPAALDDAARLPVDEGLGGGLPAPRHRRAG